VRFFDFFFTVSHADKATKTEKTHAHATPTHSQNTSSYPDFWVEPEEYGQCGSRRMFVRWAGSATNLGAYHGHKPSRHASAVSGIDLFTFNPDRSAITEVLVYRTPLAEDREEMVHGESGGSGSGAAGSLGGDGLHELRLHRLHEEPPRNKKK
jgi:hypothetical protein